MAADSLSADKTNSFLTGRWPRTGAIHPGDGAAAALNAEEDKNDVAYGTALNPC